MCSFTAIYCFSRLLKISLDLASSASCVASLSHLLSSPVGQGTLSSKEAHQHASQAGLKNLPAPQHTWMGLAQARCGRVCPEGKGKERSCGDVGTPLQHNREREQGCPLTAGLYSTVGEK